MVKNKRESRGRNKCPVIRPISTRTSMLSGACLPWQPGGPISYKKNKTKDECLSHRDTYNHSTPTPYRKYVSGEACANSAAQIVKREVYSGCDPGGYEARVV